MEATYDPDVLDGTDAAPGVDTGTEPTGEVEQDTETETDETGGAIVDIDVNVETPGS